MELLDCGVKINILIFKPKIRILILFGDKYQVEIPYQKKHYQVEMMFSILNSHRILSID